jgi:ABC-2 type transport system permease protein
MFERIIAMLIKEFAQMLRDNRMRGLMFGAPVMQLLLLGYAVNSDVKNVTTVVQDFDNSAASRDVVERLVRSGHFTIVLRTTDATEARAFVDRGQARLIVQMNKGFSRDLKSGTAVLQAIVDGTDSIVAGITLSYLKNITARVSVEALRDRYERLTGRSPQTGSLDVRSRAWFNENLESRNFYVPGVLVLVLLVVIGILSGMAIVREKEIGTIEQIIVTPIGRAEFILGKTVPFMIIGFIDVTLVTLIAVFWFEVPFRGNIGVLYLATSFFLMTMLGIGLLISTISRTQQQAMLSTFMFIFPTMLLSGFLFPIQNMPQWIQYITYVNPLRYFLVIVRSTFLKGVSFEVLLPQFVALFVLGLTILSIAVARFKKTLA